MTLGSPGLRGASHLGQPALGRPEQERRRLAALQGCMSGSGPPSSTAAHGEGSLEDAEAGRLWDRDTHTWGPRHPHPLTVPTLHSTPGRLQQYLNSAWPQSSAQSQPLCTSAAAAASPPSPPAPRLGAGVSGTGLPLFLPSSIFPPLKPRATFRKNKQWSFSPALSVLLTSEEVFPSPSGVVRSVRLGDLPPLLPHRGSLPGVLRGGAGRQDGKLSSEQKAGRQE